MIILNYDDRNGRDCYFRSQLGGRRVDRITDR